MRSLQKPLPYFLFAITIVASLKAHGGSCFAKRLVYGATQSK
jgi:hypothetical protein